jgi:dihydropteroate synthase
MFRGASRKSVIGNALDLPAEEREEGTIVTSILAAEAGYKFVRVHDVKKNVRALRMIETISQV